LAWNAEYVSAVQGASDSNPRMEDVLASLHRLSTRPRAIPCDSSDFDVPGGGHLQGIQQAWIDGRPFAVVSGSASAESYLALIALEGSAARVTAIRPLLPRPFKHAGGFQVCGDYLAVGIEDDNTKTTSRVWILKLNEFSKNVRPKPVIEIERHGEYKRATAGAVAMAKVRDRHLLCVGTWDSATIDIYQSNGNGLDDPACRFESYETWDATKADRSGWSDHDYASYQNLNLVVDTNDRVFLVGFAHAGGSDVADVFELRTEATAPVAKRLEKLCRRALNGRDTSFRHGSGLAIADARTLTILSCGYQEFTIERFVPGTGDDETEGMN
jgi:hypothetical protein